jgi:hypothetical protein
LANALFVAYRNAMLGTGTAVDLDADSIKACFVDHADITPDPATHDFINDITSAGRVPAIASCPALGTKTIGTVAAGVFDAADSTFTSLTGDASESLILFKDTGTESTSNLLAFWDTATGLPLTPNGANVTVTWHASGIYSV